MNCRFLSLISECIMPNALDTIDCIVSSRIIRINHRLSNLRLDKEAEKRIPEAFYC
ncbi:uncharacterized protein Dvar_61190 [Desulfosarcina variabilis str. Montpellier]